MEFEWDEEKRSLNLSKHGVDFERAALIFGGPIIETPDRRKNYGEGRYQAIGMFEDECFVVVFTRRGDAIRLITAWKGGRDERKAYEAYIAGGPAS